MGFWALYDLNCDICSVILSQRVSGWLIGLVGKEWVVLSKRVDGWLIGLIDWG